MIDMDQYDELSSDFAKASIPCDDAAKAFSDMYTPKTRENHFIHITTNPFIRTLFDFYINEK